MRSLRPIQKVFSPSECLKPSMANFKKYSVEPGSYIRKNFFGKYPELAEMVNHLSDEQLRTLGRGGHDAKKVYAAYKAAMEHKGQPTVILAKNNQGYGLGEAGEGRNITHQQKKLNEKELREFRTRFQVPVNDDEIADTPFYRPPQDSPEIKYLLDRRKELGGFLPERKIRAQPLKFREPMRCGVFQRFWRRDDDDGVRALVKHPAAQQGNWTQHCADHS